MRLYFGLLLAVIVLVVPSRAQSADPFGAWIALPDKNQLVYLDADGVAGVIDLPLPDGYAHFSADEFAVSPDGQIAAYTVYQTGYTRPAVAVYGILQRSLIANFAPDGMLFTSLSVAPLRAFSTDSRQLAVGYATEAGWELAVIDLQTFALAGRLNHETPALADLPRTPDSLPIPLDFRTGGSLAFALYDLSVPRASRYPAFVWEMTTSALRPAPQYETPVLDVFGPTGEVIRAGVDERLPKTDAYLPNAHYNALWRYAPALGTSAPVYTDGAWSLTSVRFVQNGRLLLTGATDGIQTRHTLLGRDGLGVSDAAITQRIYDALGTRSGYLYATIISDGAPSVVHIDLTTGASLVLWTGEARDQTPRLLWAGSNDPLTPYFTDAADYPPWGELAPALDDGGGRTTAVEAGSTAVFAAPALEIGGKATIATSNGDSLNIRSDAGTGYEIRAKARPGTVVDVGDGPRDADGFTWWYVKLPDGRAGWAVASADGRQTLVPGVDSAPVTDPDAPAAPQAPSGLAVGDMVMVRLPDTLEALRMRNGAGLDFEIIRLLPDGTMLRIAGGPQRLDDLTWWEVRTPEGNVGWVAEVIGSARVLVR